MYKRTTRVYDFLKAKKRDKKIRREAIKYGCKLPKYDNNIEFLSDEWYAIIENGTVKEKTKKGFISSISGNVYDGKSFPTFQLNSNGDISTWERNSDLSFFGMYLKDKYYKIGKM